MDFLLLWRLLTSEIFTVDSKSQMNWPLEMLEYVMQWLHIRFTALLMLIIFWSCIKYKGIYHPKFGIGSDMHISNFGRVIY